MSLPPAYQQPPSNQPQPYQPPPSNGLGVAGFVVSLVGFVLGGVLCPIGLLLSFIALFRRPRGLAIAGFVIGFLGTAIWVAVFCFFGFMTCACFNFAGKPIAAAGADAALQTASAKIEEYRTQHGGRIPTEADGNALIKGVDDGWGHQVYYQPRAAGYEVRSAGPDGQMFTTDDIVEP